MALGKNLKHKKLITSSEEKPASKKKTVRKAAPKKKKLISEPKKKASKKSESLKKIKPVAKVETPKQKKTVSPPKPRKQEEDITIENIPLPSKQETRTGVDSVLSLYIANELKERKQELRKRYTKEITDLQSKMLQFVSFEIGEETYAVDIDAVKEVVPVPALSKTPNTPTHIKGLANVRGTTYVVFDLADRFQVQNESDAKYLLIVDDSQAKASLILSLLPSTFKIAGKHISSDMHLIEDASLDVSYIKGIIQQEEKLIYYLDVAEMLKSDKAIVVPDHILKEAK